MVLEQARNVFREAFGSEATSAGIAPGRIEFIGNHTDYNGGHVLGATIDRYTAAAVQATTSGNIEIASARFPQAVILPLSHDARLAGADGWANYPLGVFRAMVGQGLNIGRVGGLRIAIASDVPLGAGLSSSAAIELATAFGIIRVLEILEDRRAIVRQCRWAENHFVGVNSGILDQGVSAFGARDHLVHIDCATETFSTIAIPTGTHFWIFKTAVEHALGEVEGLYNQRHAECMKARDILRKKDPGREYLCQFSPAEVEDSAAGMEDNVLLRARHITHEHGRVAATVDALNAGNLDAVGTLLTASHHSSRDLFRNSVPELDFLVETLAGNEHVYGARLTGGGFGGAVLAFTGDGFSDDDAEAVCKAYGKQFDHQPEILHVQTGDGARVA